MQTDSPADINDNELNQKAVDKEVYRWDVAFERLINSECYDDTEVGLQGFTSPVCLVIFIVIALTNQLI